MTKLCSDALHESSTIKECMSRAGLTFISEIEMCVEDIKVTMATGRSEAVVLTLFDLHYANLRDVYPHSLSPNFILEHSNYIYLSVRFVCFKNRKPHICLQTKKVSKDQELIRSNPTSLLLKPEMKAAHIKTDRSSRKKCMVNLKSLRLSFCRRAGKRGSTRIYC